MGKHYVGLVGVLIVGFFVSGCVVRVYQKEMPRQDIIVSGNQGYIVGSPPRQNYKPAKKTRKIIVTEIELVNPKKLEIQTQPLKEMDRKKIPEEAEKQENHGYIYKKETTAVYSEELTSLQDSGDLREEEHSVGEVDTKLDKEEDQTVKYQIYKVQKGDTLQKISYKFYGKYSLWPKIFEANKDRLENPDSIYVGQELRIPILKNK